MSPVVKSAVVRFARVVAAGAISAAIVAVPGLIVGVPAGYLVFAQLGATALITALDKLRRALAVDSGSVPPDAV